MLYKETSYLHRAVNNDDINTHKEFLIQFINSLILRACNEDTKHSVTRRAVQVGGVQPVIHLGQTRQLRFSRTDPSLSTFDHVRLLPGEHKLIPHKQRKYKYCQYLVAVARVNKEPRPEEGRPTLACQICKVSLCKNHKKLFHAR